MSSVATAVPSRRAWQASSKCNSTVAPAAIEVGRDRATMNKKELVYKILLTLYACLCCAQSTATGANAKTTRESL